MNLAAASARTGAHWVPTLCTTRPQLLVMLRLSLGLAKTQCWACQPLCISGDLTEARDLALGGGQNRKNGAVSFLHTQNGANFPLVESKYGCGFFPTAGSRKIAVFWTFCVPFGNLKVSRAPRPAHPKWRQYQMEHSTAHLLAELDFDEGCGSRRSSLSNGN